MTNNEISKLLADQSFPVPCNHPPELIETHISWVILCHPFVYKIKKPVRYSFLDFSTLPNRKYFCEREIELNQRLTQDIYLDVQPVTEYAGRFGIGPYKEGEIIDYAVRMRMIDRNLQMDILLRNNRVTATDIENLAQKIAGFHTKATIVYEKKWQSIRADFSDIAVQRRFVQENISSEAGALIDRSIAYSNSFIETNLSLLHSRLQTGYYRDVHGDLHSRNIFLLPEPQPFDCIEFNDDFRQIDVLNEVAFLCMDLDAFGRQDLSELFIKIYNNQFFAINNESDRALFTWYKSYRANVRAKVNSLRAQSADNNAEKARHLAEASRYLQLMEQYIRALQTVSHKPA